jgi:hypothetical protein
MEVVDHLDHGTYNYDNRDTVTSEEYINVNSNEPPVGLSDPKLVSQKREMFDAINRLRAVG